MSIQNKTLIKYLFNWICRRILLALLLGFLLAGCADPTPPAAPSPSLSPSAIPATSTPLPTSTLLPATESPARTSKPAPSATPTLTPTASHTPEPAGCLPPPEDYTRVQVNGVTLNRRTLAMLEQAAALYGGELDITGHHLTQGSYTSSVSASFGTHDGGGAVDLSVMRQGTYTVLWDEIEPLIAALRAAGFAAWLREYGELYPDSPIHIHAIAVGDAQLSQPARTQLDGPSGYFRGFTGLPADGKPPQPDRHGGPLVCQWMIEAGYGDLRLLTPTVLP